MQSKIDEAVCALLRSIATTLLWEGDDRAADAIYAEIEKMTAEPARREGNVVPFPIQPTRRVSLEREGAPPTVLAANCEGERAVLSALIDRERIACDDKTA